MSSLKMLAQLDSLAERVDALERDVAELKQRRKPGRPRKVVNGDFETNGSGSVNA